MNVLKNAVLLLIISFFPLFPLIGMDGWYLTATCTSFPYGGKTRTVHSKNIVFSDKQIEPANIRGMEYKLQSCGNIKNEENILRFRLVNGGFSEQFIAKQDIDKLDKNSVHDRKFNEWKLYLVRNDDAQKKLSIKDFIKKQYGNNNTKMLHMDIMMEGLCDGIFCKIAFWLNLDDIPEDQTVVRPASIDSDIKLNHADVEGAKVVASPKNDDHRYPIWVWGLVSIPVVIGFMGLIVYLKKLSKP